MKSKDEKELLKAQYENMVRRELDKKHFNTNVHGQFLWFLFSVVLTGAFFSWCSAANESYFPTLLRKNEVAMYIFCSTPLIIFFVYEFTVLKSAKNIRRKLDYEFDMNTVTWGKKFYKFIIMKTGYVQGPSFIENQKQIKEIMETHEDINFSRSDFANFLEMEYKKHKLDVSFDFYTNLATCILLDYEIKGSLIHETDNRYTFIVKDNPEIQIMAIDFL